MSSARKATLAFIGLAGALALGVGFVRQSTGALVFSGVTLLGAALGWALSNAARRNAGESRTGGVHGGEDLLRNEARDVAETPVSSDPAPDDVMPEDVARDDAYGEDAIGFMQDGSLADPVSSPSALAGGAVSGERRSTEVESFSAPIGTEPGDALEALVGAVEGAGLLKAASLWLLDPATRTMRVIAAFGEVAPDDPPLPVAESVVGEASERGAALLAPVESTGSSGPDQSRWRYAIPLRTGSVRGAAALDFSWQAPDAEVLNRGAAQTRGVLTAALSLHASRNESAAAHELVETLSELVELADEDEILRRGMEHAIVLAGADTGSIMMFDEERGVLVIRAAVGLPADIIDRTRVREGEGVAGVVLATGSPLVIEDVDARAPRGRRHGVLSAISMPIRDHERVLGVLNVGSRSFQARFSQSQLENLKLLGRVLGGVVRNARLHSSSRELYLETVHALALALETKDPYTRGATDRVHDLAVRLGTAVGLDADELAALSVASLLHDIGMAAAGDLSRLGDRPLTTVEWATLKMHPAIGAHYIEQSPALKAAVPIVYHHHEHYDGGGYLHGLAGEQIPLGARVLSVVDAYVAMTSPRSYRAALSKAGAVAELLSESGKQFDPAVVDAMVELLEGESQEPKRSSEAQPAGDARSGDEGACEMQPSTDSTLSEDEQRKEAASL